SDAATMSSKLAWSDSIWRTVRARSSASRSACPGSIGPVRPGPQAALVDLAGADLGQLGEDDHALGGLEVGEPLADEGDEVVLVGGGPGVQRHVGHGHLAPAVVGPPHDGGLPHRWVCA